MISKDPNERSYIAETSDGKQCQRNRQLLKKKIYVSNENNRELLTQFEVKDDKNIPVTSTQTGDTEPKTPDNPSQNSTLILVAQKTSLSKIKISGSGCTISPLRYKD